MYGISQNPNTKDYIVVFKGEYCEKCGEKYIDEQCKPCQISYLKQNFSNWTSENEKIDNFIREMQLKFNNYDVLIFEWIPYNQLNSIKEISKNDFSYLVATWKDGPLYRYNDYNKKWIREPYKDVVLKYLPNSQSITEEFLNEV